MASLLGTFFGILLAFDLAVKSDCLLSESETQNVGEPLFLTPYIERGDVEGGRDRSLVRGLTVLDESGRNQTPAPASYSGFFTVNKTHQSNMFFWFFPAIRPNGSWEDAPVVVWLQGGPGSSSMFGLFYENGPLGLTKELKLQSRQYHWAEAFNVLYVDNPVGTGFSFTQDDAGYVTNEVEVGRDLYSMLSQFLQLFPMLRPNPLYITGESYAGKYVPALAYTIYKQNKHGSESEKMNLAGVAIGDGFIDPLTMENYGQLLYGVGLLDENQRDQFLDIQEQGITAIRNGDYASSFDIFDKLIGGDLQDAPTLFYNFTGLNNYFNYLLTEVPEDAEFYSKFVQLPEVREAIHVGDLNFTEDNAVEMKLRLDEMQSTKAWLVTLLNNDYKVLLYTGQLDIIVGYQMAKDFIQTLDWKHVKDYRNAARKIWKVNESDQEVAGYVKNVFNLWEVLVRNAGHMVPTDQPRAALDLIQRFIWGTL